MFRRAGLRAADPRGVGGRCTSEPCATVPGRPSSGPTTCGPPRGKETHPQPSKVRWPYLCVCVCARARAVWLIKWEWTGWGGGWWGRGSYPIFFHFHVAFGNNWPNNRLDPPLMCENVTRMWSNRVSLCTEPVVKLSHQQRQQRRGRHLRKRSLKAIFAEVVVLADVNNHFIDGVFSQSCLSGVWRWGSARAPSTCSCGRRTSTTCDAASSGTKVRLVVPRGIRVGLTGRRARSVNVFGLPQNCSCTCFTSL